MRYDRLARVFQRILASSAPISAGAVLVACGTATSPSGGSPNASPPEVADAATDTTIAAATDAAPGDEGSINADAATAQTIVTSCGETLTLPLGPLQCGAAQCFPLDAGTFASIDAGDAGSLFHDQCVPYCGFGSFSCEPVVDAGVLQIRCHPDCTGRRPEGLEFAPRAASSTLGAHFAEMAYLEKASVAAFRRLRRELAAHGAPRRLVRAAERAARDEIRHARMTASLARRYGGDVSACQSRVARSVRTIEAIATENAVEGCVREAFGALLATRQAAAADDPVIRTAMDRIARDETRHAALAFEVDAWIRGRLGAEARARVEGARRASMRELIASAGDPPPALRGPLGLPTRDETRFLMEAIVELAA